MRRILTAYARDLRAFLLRGNLISIAVGFALAWATVRLIEVLVEALISPLIAALFDEANLQFMHFSIGSGEIAYGALIVAALVFALVVAATYLLVVAPFGPLRAHEGISARTRPCPECTSSIPMAAKRCPRCTAPVPPA